jgi:hypothetical protein
MLRVSFQTKKAAGKHFEIVPAALGFEKRFYLKLR